MSVVYEPHGATADICCTCTPCEQERDLFHDIWQTCERDYRALRVQNSVLLDDHTALQHFMQDWVFQIVAEQADLAPHLGEMVSVTVHEFTAMQCVEVLCSMPFRCLEHACAQS